MFSNQAIRLLRADWKTPVPLAQEIFAILSSVNLPLTHDGPVTLNGTLTVTPPINVKGGGTIFNITDGAGNVTGSVTFGPNGLESRDADGNPFDDGGGDGGSDVQTAFAGTIASGTGDTYQVMLNTGPTVTVTQTNINPGQTIPAGATVELVVLDTLTNTYSMNFPVYG